MIPMLFQHHLSAISVSAPAKLNLFLNVIGKRADGFHELETLMVSVGVYDTLRFSEDATGEIKLRCFNYGAARTADPRNKGELSAGADNLVVRAAELLRSKTGTPGKPNPGARIELYKRIPLAAGLAGGSSDAAATLVGLNRCWKLGLSLKELHPLAAELGSDVPFFLNTTGAAVCTGRGEIIDPIELPMRLHFVIVRPRTGLSTALVFKHCQPSNAPSQVAELVASLKQGRLARGAQLLYNTLQEPAERLNADVTQLKQVFSRQPVIGHMMSGSGTSYFGLCHNRRQALQVSARLKAMRLGDVFVTQSRP